MVTQAVLARIKSNKDYIVVNSKASRNVRHHCRWFRYPALIMSMTARNKAMTICKSGKPPNQYLAHSGQSSPPPLWSHMLPNHVSCTLSGSDGNEFMVDENDAFELISTTRNNMASVVTAKAK